MNLIYLLKNYLVCTDRQMDENIVVTQEGFKRAQSVFKRVHLKVLN
jgi:hypothetical protein